MERKRVQRRAERERTVGLDPEDDAARWLTEHDPPPKPAPPKAPLKSKLLHQWQQRQLRGDR